MEAMTKRRPIRGLLEGIMFGLGLMLVAVGQGWAALGTWPPFLILHGGIIAGTLWSTFGPAKAAKSPTAEAAAGNLSGRDQADVQSMQDGDGAEATELP